jgi:phosphoesterase RecJ-like protein
MSICWNRFAEIVRGHRRFLLTSHVRPDCDALGSELALALILEGLGKEARIVNAQAIPPNLAFLDPQRRIKTLGVDVQSDEIANHDVFIVLDTSAWVQLGAMAEVLRASAAKKLVIDHHVSEDDLGTEPFKDTAAEATGRLVLQAAQALGVALSPDMARALFAAMATDTGWFRFASTTSDTYRYVAELVDAGAVPAQIYRELYEQDTLGRVRLRGLILSRVVGELGGRLAHTYVRKDDFSAVGALPSDTEDVINAALAIAGTQFAVILVEQLRGGFKISFRSRCALDCSRLAEQFGGGGHRAAAGAFVPGSLEEAQARVLGLVRDAFASCPDSPAS